MRYKEVEDGEWIRPRRRNYYVQCCGCGLAHRVDFKLIKWGRGKRILFRAFRLSLKGKKGVNQMAKKKGKSELPRDPGKHMTPGFLGRDKVRTAQGRTGYTEEKKLGPGGKGRDIPLPSKG